MRIDNPTLCTERVHVAGCRTGRPLCRWRRRKAGLCHCTAYHFPHRDRSGACKHGDMPVALRRQLEAREKEHESEYDFPFGALANPSSSKGAKYVVLLANGSVTHCTSRASALKLAKADADACVAERGKGWVWCSTPTAAKRARKETVPMPKPKKRKRSRARSNPGRTPVTLHNPTSKRVESGTIKDTTQILKAACSRAGASDYLFDQKALTRLELMGLIYVDKRIPSGDEEIWKYKATDAGRAAFARGTVPNPYPTRGRRKRSRYARSKGTAMPRTRRRKARKSKKSHPAKKRRRHARRKMTAAQRKYFGGGARKRTTRRRRRRSHARAAYANPRHRRRRVTHRRRRRNPKHGKGGGKFGWKKVLLAAGVTIAAAAAVKVAPLAVSGPLTTPDKLAMTEKVVAGAAVVGGAFLARKRPALGAAMVVGALVAIGLDFVTNKAATIVAQVKFPGLPTPVAEPGTAGWNQLGAVVADDMGAVVADDMGDIYSPGYGY